MFDAVKVQGLQLKLDQDGPLSRADCQYLIDELCAARQQIALMIKPKPGKPATPTIKAPAWPTTNKKSFIK